MESFFYIFFAFVILLGIYKSIVPSQKNKKSFGKDTSILDQTIIDQQNANFLNNQQDMLNQSVIDQANVQNQIQDHISMEQQNHHH